MKDNGQYLCLFLLIIMVISAASCVGTGTHSSLFKTTREGQFYADKSEMNCQFIFQNIQFFVGASREQSNQLALSITVIPLKLEDTFLLDPNLITLRIDENTIRPTSYYCDASKENHNNKLITLLPRHLLRILVEFGEVPNPKTDRFRIDLGKIKIDSDSLVDLGEVEIDLTQHKSIQRTSETGSGYFKTHGYAKTIL